MKRYKHIIWVENFNWFSTLENYDKVWCGDLSGNPYDWSRSKAGIINLVRFAILANISQSLEVRKEYLAKYAEPLF